MEDELIKIMDDLDMENTAALLQNIDCPVNDNIKARIKNKVYAKAAMIKPPAKKRYFREPFIIAAAMFVLLFCMGAAYYSGIAQFFGPYFIKNNEPPLNQEENYLLEQSGQVVHTQATGEGYTVALNGIVGDGDRMYGYVRVSADDGTPMDKLYNFKHCFLYLAEDGAQQNTKGQYIMPEPLPDDNPQDNAVYFMITFKPFIEGFGERVNLAGAEVAINFQDLVECSDTGFAVSDLAYHDWEIPFTLQDNPTARTFDFQDITVPLEGCSYTIKKMRLSPMSLNIDGILEATGNAQGWASFPIRIIQKDGTVVDSFYANTSTTTTQNMPTGQMAMQKNIIFYRPIDPGSVQAIAINGVDIELNNEN